MPRKKNQLNFHFCFQHFRLEYLFRSKRFRFIFTPLSVALSPIYFLCVCEFIVCTHTVCTAPFVQRLKILEREQKNTIYLQSFLGFAGKYKWISIETVCRFFLFIITIIYSLFGLHTLNFCALLCCSRLTWIYVPHRSSR